MVGQSNTVVLRTELAEAIPKKGVPLSFYESIHDATTEGTVSGERERQQLEKNARARAMDKTSLAPE